MKRTKIIIEADEGEKTCPRCHGKWDSVHGRTNDPYAFPLQPCLKCNGTGKVPKGDP